MKRTATVALALGAVVVVSGMRPAAAEVVIGGSNQPAVEVNWGVIDRLGPAPTLADMLKADVPLTNMRQQLSPSGRKAEPITFRPYKPEPRKAARKPAAQPAVAKEKPVAKAEPVVAKAPEPVEAKAPEPVEAKAPEPVVAKAPEPAPAAKPVKAAPPAPPKPEPTEPAVAKAEPAPEPAKDLPKVTLPSVPEPAKPEPAKPVALTKAEPPPPPAPPVPVAAAVPAPVAAPAPAPEPAVAALPPAPPAAAPTGTPDNLTIPFGADNARLPDIARADLQKLASRMEKDESLGLQLLAYAGGDEASASKARRLSLSRALEVRKFLMDQGVRATRIEVRALGAKSDGGPADRVDAVVVAR